MITAKTSAMITAIALLGAVAPAAFAQVTQSGSVSNTQSASVTGTVSSGTNGDSSLSVAISQESGGCVFNVGTDNDQSETGNGDASSTTSIGVDNSEADCS
jgi:hypothetical protein